MHQSSARLTKGVTVVEVLIGIAIFTVVTAMVTSTLATYFSTSGAAVEEIKAVHLVREGHELVRFARDEAWSNVSLESIDTARYIDISGSSITFSGTPEIIDTDFTRTVYFRNVYRDGDDDIVDSSVSGASVDSGSRYVDVSVSWDAETVTTRSLLTNIFNQ